MRREEAYKTLTTLIKNPNLIKHHLACEAIMISLCQKLIPNADQETIAKWGIVGLLHDAYYELTKNVWAECFVIFYQSFTDVS